MEEINEKGFRIFGDFDPEEQSAAVDEEIEPAAVQPNSRPVFIAAFSFCILGALLFFGYYQLNSRINRIESTGTTEIKGLNKEIDARLALIANKVEEQGTATARQGELLGKQLDGLGSRIEKNVSTISGLEKKVENISKSTSGDMAGIEKRMAAAGDRMSGIESGLAQTVADIENDMDSMKRIIEDTAKTAGNIELLRKSIAQIQTRVDGLSSRVESFPADPVDPEAISRQIASFKNDVNGRIKTAQQQIEDLTGEIDALEAMIKSIKNLNSQPPAAPSGGSRTNIIEQEIE